MAEVAEAVVARRWVCVFVLWLLAVGVAAVGPRPASAAEVLDVLLRPTSVSAYGGVVAWSRFEPGVGRYRLVVRSGAQTRTMPVRSRTVPFDVDVGPGADGAPEVVYSRCRREPKPQGVVVPWSRARGCSLYRLNLGDGHERRLPIGRRRGALVLPTVWRSRLAYVRHGSSRLASPQIRVVDLSTGRRRRVSGGSETARGSESVLSMDLRGAHLAFAWVSERRRPSGSPFWLSELRAGKTDRPARLVDRVEADALEPHDAFRFAPSFTPTGGLTYLRGAEGFRRQRLVTVAPATGAEQAIEDREWLISASAGGGRLTYSTGRAAALDRACDRYDGAASEPLPGCSIIIE